MNKSPDNNIASLLDVSALRFPDRPAIYYKDSSMSFSELQECVHSCAVMLLKYGLKAGDRVIIMTPMSPDLYISLLAVIRCGAVAVFVDPWISMRRIAAFASFAEPSCFIGVPKSHLLRLLSPQLARLKLTVSTGSVFAAIPARYSLRNLCHESVSNSPAAVAEDDPALITFTTGSSNTPKGTNRTHGFLISQYNALCDALQYKDDDVDMPMFPVFALRNIAAGITSVVPEIDFKHVAEADSQIIQGQINTCGVNMLTASPPLIDRLASLDNPPSLRRIITGGAPVNEKQLKVWRNSFPNTAIDIVYGSTEAEPVAHLSLEDRLATNRMTGACCGKPVSSVRSKVIKITHAPVSAEELDDFTLPQGKIGELVVAADHICRDYYRNPEAVKQNKVIEPDGTCWHRMGDTGYFDEEGRFYLTGRVHSTILRNGEVLHAQLVEEDAGKLIPQAGRIAAFEDDGSLIIVVEGDASVLSSDVMPDADRLIFTKRRLPLDPRHNSKVDYALLKSWMKRGKL